MQHKKLDDLVIEGTIQRYWLKKRPPIYKRGLGSYAKEGVAKVFYDKDSWSIVGWTSK